jgi:peptidoglycan hydrolase-like protein with peptidoglycan-binding domain
MVGTATRVDGARPEAAAVDPDPGTGRPPRRRRRWVLGGVGLVAVVAGVAVAVSRGGDDGDGDASTTEATATAEVERRTLVHSETIAATLDFGEPRGIAAGRAGTVTFVAAAGAAVDRGQELFSIDRRPTVLLLGTVPLYRDLDASVDDGPDVAQLEENLTALGYTDDGALTVDEDFDAHTTEAVEAWQEARGVEATGRVDAGDVVFQLAAVRVSTAAADVGSPVQAESSVVEVTARTQVVRLGLEANQADLAQLGAAVQVALPDGTEVAGKVATITDAASADAASGGGGASSGTGATSDTTSTVLDVTITLDDPAAAAAYTTASVDVEFTTAQKEGVLAVPLTALLALAGGGYAVEVPQDEGTTALVAVESGMYADGYVEISGDGIDAGTQVVVPK